MPGIAYRSFFCSFLIVLFITGCSSSTPSTNSGSSTASSAASTTLQGLPDPCSLITQEELETALGKGAAKTSLFNERISMQQCRMRPATTGAIDTIIMSVHKADLWDAAKKAMLPPNGDAKSVSALGDDAFENRAIGYNV